MKDRKEVINGIIFKRKVCGRFRKINKQKLKIK